MLCEPAQQLLELCRHVGQGDAVVGLGKLSAEPAGGHLAVELTQSFIPVQKVTQTGAVLQQQPHKLRLVANQSQEQGLVEVAGLDRTDGFFADVALKKKS